MHIKAKSIRVTQTQLNGEDKYVNTAAFIDTSAKCCIMNASLADKLEINYSSNSSEELGDVIPSLVKLMERMWNVIFLGVKVRDKGSMYFKEIDEKPLFWGKLPVTVGENVTAPV
nr:9300_t:CDS:2 [Entrophospora candida]